MIRKMVSRRTLFILISIMTFFTAVYFTLFNHPPAEETLMANKQESIRRPDWMKNAPVQEAVIPAAPQQQAADTGLAQMESNANNKLIVAANTNDVLEENKKISRNLEEGAKPNIIKEESKEKVNILAEGDIKAEQHNTGTGRHGLKLFDWDKWISDNGFVSVGKIWAFCDEPDPPVVGAALLMADESGGIKIVTVMNTTFENSILFGTIAVTVEYGGVRLYTNEFPVCDMAEEDPYFTCPMKGGDQYYMREDHVPGLLPAGNYYTEAKLIDHKQKTVVCANCDLNIK
ncbi:uncharacterized protein [Antedon mediterranea]|uniref:uncharacterized protein n=1 Tax=Antedon mediterranea TaxID=105859 RepID=UPI003AF97BB4